MNNRETSAIKQKLEGLTYRTIARNLDVNYRNVYNWIKHYKEYGLNGISSKRRNAVRYSKISLDKNKQMIREIISRSPTAFGYLKNILEYQVIRIISYYNSRNKCQSNADMENCSLFWDGIERTKLALEHADDYEKKKKILDNYKKDLQYF